MNEREYSRPEFVHFFVLSRFRGKAFTGVFRAVCRNKSDPILGVFSNENLSEFCSCSRFKQVSQVLLAPCSSIYMMVVRAIHFA